MPKKTDIAIPADPNDPEDRDVTYEGLEMGNRSRKLRMLRNKLGLSQPQFAKRIGVPVGTLRDWEQTRIRISDHTMVLLAAIEKHPDVLEVA